MNRICFGYRLSLFALAILGAGIAADAYATDTINRYYFRTHYVGPTILIWVGAAVAIAATAEGITLVTRRRLAKPTDSSAGLWN